MRRYTALWNINVKKQQPPETCVAINPFSARPEKKYNK